MERHKNFEILETFPGESKGTTQEWHEKVRCPECGTEFIRDVSEGCFHHNIHPLNCPKCRYPASYYMRQLDAKIGEKEEGKRVFNPTRRLS